MAYRNLLDWDAYLVEEEEIESLDDREEAALRERMLEAISKSVLDYNSHIDEYNYLKHRKMIESRGLIYKSIAKRTATRKWDLFFASHLSPEEKRKIFYSSFKWHMFSYEKCDALKGDAANEAFDSCQKTAAYPRRFFSFIPLSVKHFFQIFLDLHTWADLAHNVKVLLVETIQRRNGIHVLIVHKFHCWGSVPRNS